MDHTSVILISGSNSGFGRLSALTLARGGHTVFAGIRESQDKNKAAAQELRDVARTAALDLHILDLDVTDDASVEEVVQRVIEHSVRLDVLVNNAGVAYLGPTEAFTVEQARQQFDVNFFGALRLNRAIIPHFRARGSGLLVHVSSVLGRLAFPFTGLYAASKFALEGLSEAYRFELAPFGIDSVLVEPATYPTGIGSKGVYPADDERFSLYQTAFNRFATAISTVNPYAPSPDPQEVANAIAALIAQPFGERPARTVLAPDGLRGGVEGINSTHQHVIAAALQGLNLAASEQPPTA